MTRKLIEIPMWHSKIEQVHGRAQILYRKGVDNDTLAEIIVKQKEILEPLNVKLGEYTKELAPFIDEEIKGHDGIKIFRDSLTNPEQQLPALKQYAQLGSPMDYLMFAIMRDTGAVPVATEDPEAYEKATQLILQKELTSGETIEDTLINNRDIPIAERIDYTLKEGEVGILFMGMDHDVGGAIERAGYDIEVVKPPFLDKYKDRVIPKGMELNCEFQLFLNDILERKGYEI